MDVNTKNGYFPLEIENLILQFAHSSGYKRIPNIWIQCDIRHCYERSIGYRPFTIAKIPTDAFCYLCDSKYMLHLINFSMCICHAEYICRKCKCIICLRQKTKFHDYCENCI